MTREERTRWKNWADGLRQKMMTNLTGEVTKSVDAIVSETGTTKPESTLRSVRFWSACQSGKRPNDFLTVAGFDVEFELDDQRHVREVTLRLNHSWMPILQRVVNRKEA